MTSYLVVRRKFGCTVVGPFVDDSAAEAYRLELPQAESSFVVSEVFCDYSPHGFLEALESWREIERRFGRVRRWFSE